MTSSTGTDLCLGMLLKLEGINIHCTTDRNETALHLAANARAFECVRLLLKGGIDVDARDQFYKEIFNTFST